MISADGQHGATAPINFFRAYEQLFIDNGGTVLYRVEGLKLIAGSIRVPRGPLAGLRGTFGFSAVTRRTVTLRLQRQRYDHTPATLQNDYNK